MRERPILFSGPMVRALLEGRKSQTRRVVKPQPPKSGKGWYPSTDRSRALYYVNEAHLKRGLHLDFQPYGVPGDRLWLRETWAPYPDPHTPPNDRPLIAYRATQEAECQNVLWRPSIHMPRWASRLTLEVVAIRVERLQDISEADAKAEGVWLPEGQDFLNARRFFASLWDSLNAKRAPWASNPWVWVVDFRRVTA